MSSAAAAPSRRGIAFVMMSLTGMAVVAAVLAVKATRSGADILRQGEINAALPALHSILAELLTAESGQRGYLLSGDAASLQPHLAAIEAVEARLQELETRQPLIAPRSRLEAVRGLVHRKLAETKRTLRLNEAGRREEALDAVMRGKGQRLTEELLARLGAEIGRLTAERDDLSRRLAEDVHKTRFWLLAGVMALAGFSILALRQVALSMRSLRAAEQHARAVAENVPACVAHFDAQRRITFANALAAALYGQRPDTVLGRTVVEARGEDFAALLEPYVRQALSGADVQFETSTATAGGMQHFQHRYVPDIGEEPRPRGFYSVSMDITEVKETEQRLRAIADNLPVLITYLDAQLTIRFINATVKDWLGVTPHQVVGRPLADVIGPALFAQREAELRKALTGDPRQFEVCSTALGLTRHIQNSYIPDIRPDGSVAGIYALSFDITEMKKAQQQLAELARSDPLTGLPNRRHFEEVLDHALLRSRRDGTRLGLLFLDIDHFKAINDRFGHGAGDEVLKEFAHRLQCCVRSSDVVARLAGDEFVALLLHISNETDAHAVAEKIVLSMSKPVSVGNFFIEVRASIGVAVAAAESAAAKPLMEQADQALYRAKLEGRNRVASWQGGPAA